MSQSTRNGNGNAKVGQMRTTLNAMMEEKRNIQDKLKNQNQTSESINNLKLEMQILTNNMETLQQKLDRANEAN